MTFISFALPALAAFALVACNGPRPPIAGGPCTYESSVVTGTVTEVDERRALLEANGEELYVSAEYLDTLPEIGDVLTLNREQILTGTCTPEIWSVVEES